MDSLLGGLGRISILSFAALFIAVTGGYSIRWALSFCAWLDNDASRFVRQAVYAYAIIAPLWTFHSLCRPLF